jgi:hypothetical protein
LRQEKRQLRALERRIARLKELHRHLKPARFTGFELRQLDAVRKELDADYETSIARSDRTSQPRVSSKLAP